MPYEKIGVVCETCKNLMVMALMLIDDIEDEYSEVSKDTTPTRFTAARVLNLMKELMNYYNQERLGKIGKEIYCAHDLEWQTNNICEGIHNCEF